MIGLQTTVADGKPLRLMMKVGFIGLGQMGMGMGVNLLKAGHVMTVYNRMPAKAKTLSIAETCRGDTVVTMLANDGAAESVVPGRDGVIANVLRGAPHISSSTIGVALSQLLIEEHARRGQRFVAAPVFGGTRCGAPILLYGAKGTDHVRVLSGLR